MESISGHHIAELNRAEFFTSHEALHLPFEQARTRRVPTALHVVQRQHASALDW